MSQPLSTGGPVAMPWVQYLWIVRLREGRSMFDDANRQHAALLVGRWLTRWERRAGSVVSHRSISFAQAATGSLIVHFRAIVLVPAEVRGYVAAEVNRPADAGQPQPHGPRIERATVADLDAIRRTQA